MADTKKAKPKFSTNIHHIFATDKGLQEDGSWVVINELYDLAVKVRRMKSTAVAKANEKIIKEMFGEKRLRTPEDFSRDQAETITKRLLVEAVIVDWRNVRDDVTGEEIPYSKEAAEAFVEIEDFRDFVFQAANERDTFRAKHDEEAVKN